MSKKIRELITDDRADVILGDAAAERLNQWKKRMIETGEIDEEEEVESTSESWEGKLKWDEWLILLVMRNAHILAILIVVMLILWKWSG